jgi:hypothetical protein
MEELLIDALASTCTWATPTFEQNLAWYKVIYAARQDSVDVERVYIRQLQTINFVMMQENKWVSCFRAVMSWRAKVNEEADHAARHMVARSLGRKRAARTIILHWGLRPVKGFMYCRIADKTMVGR